MIHPFRWSALQTRLSLSELSGALGDLGTLLPLLVALSKTGQISLSSSLLFGGIFNILTGVYYDIPMCVQPMKAIAATAIAQSAAGFNIQDVVASGFWVSLVVLFLGATGLVRLVYKYIPIEIVRGIQLGTGIRLVTSGIAQIQKSFQWDFASWHWMDNFVISLIGLIIILSLFHSTRNVSALILFFFGLIMAVVNIWVLNTRSASVPFPGIYAPPIIVPSWGSLKNVFLQASLGQIPLTLLNSVVAVSKLADDLYWPHLPPTTTFPIVSVTSVSVSVGLMNIVGMWFGAMPYCHGSGGLAGQYRFGARSGLSVIVLGIFKIIIGLVFGTSLVGMLASFPNSILGLMLCLSGIELCCACKDMGIPRCDASSLDSKMEGSDDEAMAVMNVTKIRAAHNAFVVMLICGLGSAGFNNDGVGFLLGALSYLVLNAGGLLKRQGARSN